MDPLTIDDLLLLLGRKEAHVAQLLRHIAALEARPRVRAAAEVVPVRVAPDGQRQS